MIWLSEQAELFVRSVFVSGAAIVRPDVTVIRHYAVLFRYPAVSVIFFGGIVFRFVQRLDEPDFLYFVLACFLAFCLNSILSQEYFRIYLLGSPVFMLTTENHFYLRMNVNIDFHQILNCIVAHIERESLDIETFLPAVIVYCRIGFPGVKLFYFQQVLLISVAQVERRSVVCAVAEDGQDVLSGVELP